MNAPLITINLGPGVTREDVGAFCLAVISGSFYGRMER